MLKTSTPPKFLWGGGVDVDVYRIRTANTYKASVKLAGSKGFDWSVD